MSIELGDPRFLFLLLLVPALWLVPGRAKNRLHSALRTALVVLAILALARPVALRQTASAHHVFVADATDSAMEDDRRRGAELVRRLLEAGEAAESRSVVELGPGALDLGDLPPAVRRVAAPDSSLSTALEVAAAAIPDGARGSVTVLSDGLATDRRWGPVVQDFQRRGIPVHAVHLRGPGADLRPVALETLDEFLRVGQTARLVAEVAGSSEEFAARLVGPGGELDLQEGLSGAGVTRVEFSFEPDASGFLELAVEVIPAAASGAGEPRARFARVFAVQDPLRVLYLGERMEGGAARLRELLGSGFSVDAAGDAESGLPGLSGYDLAVLDDRPAASLPDLVQRELVERVIRDGLGLLACGGPAAFGPGGYFETPLAAVLPLEFVQKEEKRDPSTTLVVIIDTSGSMGGNRVQLAKEVARLAVRRLLPHDKVGIVEFYGAKRWAAPIQPASNSIELERALNRLDAGGGTVILPAIEEAFYGLQNVQTRYKHVLVLTDGGVETGAFEPMLRNMADKGMNVSSVLIGPEAHSEFLVNLANWGKGRFYNVPNRFNLPEILLKQPASARLPAYRPGRHPLRPRAGPGWWGEVDPRSAPPLAGYVETRPRPGAEILLETEEGAHPVLASWRYGLGRVTAFTTEPTGPGTAPWRDWDGYGRLLARVASRTAADSSEPFRYALERRDAQVILTAARRRAGAGSPAARVLGEGGVVQDLAFSEWAPDRFRTALTVAPDLEVRILAGEATRLVSAAREDVAPEANVDPRRALDLQGLAATTGGTFLELADALDFEPAAGGAARSAEVLRLWPLALLAALGLYLVDVWYRRRAPA